MTGNRILLDTNIISALLKGDTNIADNIDQSEDVYIPVVVIGELYYGAENSTQIKKNIINLTKLSNTYEVLPVDMKTAGIYGGIKAKLRKKGTPIPENDIDIWIAAISQQHNLTLVTRDGHFSHVEGLASLNW